MAAPKGISANASQEQETQALERISLGDLHQRLLEQYAPPSIIINENHEVVHLSEKARDFMHVTGGEPSNNILKLIKPELRQKLRTALYQALQKQTNIEVKNLPVKINGNTEIINLHVRPVLRTNDTAHGFILLIFESSQDKQVKNAVEIYPGQSEPVTLQLEEELIGLKTQLRSSNEQFEVQTEELKASNEELLAMNEELRSAAEELETGKEELQSVNEELITVNQELKIKIEEVSQSNNDFQNIINSTAIGTIFLDRYFRVKLFTPAVKEIFNLITADIGRPLSDITSKLEYTNILKDTEDVLKKLQTIEREVTVNENHTYLMQISPYRTAEDRISGVVISFVNVTRLKYAETSMHASEEQMRLILESAKDYAIFTLDLDLRINTWNSGAENMFGYSETEIIGKSGDVLFIPSDRKAGVPQTETQKALKAGRGENERWHLRKNGAQFYGSGVTMPLRDDVGTTIGFVIIMRDLTEKKKAEDSLCKSEERLRITMEGAADYAIITTNTDGIIERWNTGAERTFEYKADELTGKSASIIFTDEDRAAGVPEEEMRTAREEGRAPDERWHQRKNGSRFFMSGIMRPIYNPELTGYVKVARDMTEQKKAEEKLKIAEERHRIALQSAEMSAWDWNVVED